MLYEDRILFLYFFDCFLVELIYIYIYIYYIKMIFSHGAIGVYSTMSEAK